MSISGNLPAPAGGDARLAGPAVMPRGFSLYLDAVRFLVAVFVVVSHTGHKRFSHGPLQALHMLDMESDAVIVFFVLSGFVIAFTTFTRQRGAQAFAEARLARLYSVVIPALILTFLLDTAGAHLFP